MKLLHLLLSFYLRIASVTIRTSTTIDTIATTTSDDDGVFLLLLPILL